MDYEKKLKIITITLKKQIIHQYSQEWDLNSAKKYMRCIAQTKRNGSVGYALCY
jgi:hypothetical protein